VDYLTPDGVRYPLHVPGPTGRWVINKTGLGLPPLDVVTSRGPAQHGDTVAALYLQPRVVQMLIRQQFGCRDDYWTGRRAFLDALRWNRQAVATAALPGTLEFILPGNVRRRLAVQLTDGPQFEAEQRDQWDEFAFQETLRFVAHDPTFWDPILKSASYAPAPNLVFPITFPIMFGQIDTTRAVAYAGTWLSYPTIAVTGPATSPRIDNLTTGEFIQVTGTIPAGVVLTIALSYGAKLATDSAGNNWAGNITTTSDLASFHIAPSPEAPGGVNQLRARATGPTAGSGIVISWYERYIAI
jgi:hypothetical protein